MLVASRAAVCIDNARLYDRERRTALALQRACYPAGRVSWQAWRSRRSTSRFGDNVVGRGAAPLRLAHALGSALLHVAEHVARHSPHLDFLGAFGYAVPAVVTVDVLEGLVP